MQELVKPNGENDDQDQPEPTLSVNEISFQSMREFDSSD